MKEERFLIRDANEDCHDWIVDVAKTSTYTKDFTNRLMFSPASAYEKGWIKIAVDTEGEWQGELDNIVGFTCVRHKTRVPETMLYFITVLPHLRSLGIGERLIEAVMRDGPHSVMSLNVMKENTAAVRFYRRMGFEIAGDALKGQAHRMTRSWE